MRSLKLRIVYFFARSSPVCESAVQPQKIQSQFFCLAIVYLRISCTALQNSPNLRLLTTSAYNPHSTALYSPHFAPRLVVSGQRPCPPKRGQDNGQARGVVASGQFGWSGQDRQHCWPKSGRSCWPQQQHNEWLPRRTRHDWRLIGRARKILPLQGPPPPRVSTVLPASVVSCLCIIIELWIIYIIRYSIKWREESKISNVPFDNLATLMRTAAAPAGSPGCVLGWWWTLSSDIRVSWVS